jgi:predicted RNA-binding protein
MCEARVYIEKEGNLEELMDNVVSIKPEKDKLVLTNLFGEQKFVNAEVKEIKLLDHKVVLQEKKP